MTTCLVGRGQEVRGAPTVRESERLGEHDQRFVLHTHSFDEFVRLGTMSIQCPGLLGAVVTPQLRAAFTAAM
jgi:hypothetical protein